MDRRDLESLPERRNFPTEPNQLAPLWSRSGNTFCHCIVIKTLFGQVV
jgi:hypothetical protein